MLRTCGTCRALWLILFICVVYVTSKATQPTNGSIEEGPTDSNEIKKEKTSDKPFKNTEIINIQTTIKNSSKNISHITTRLTNYLTSTYEQFTTHKPTATNAKTNEIQDPSRKLSNISKITRLTNYLTSTYEQFTTHKPTTTNAKTSEIQDPSKKLSNISHITTRLTKNLTSTYEQFTTHKPTATNSVTNEIQDPSRKLPNISKITQLTDDLTSSRVSSTLETTTLKIIQTEITTIVTFKSPTAKPTLVFTKRTRKTKKFSTTTRNSINTTTSEDWDFYHSDSEWTLEKPLKRVTKKAESPSSIKSTVALIVVIVLCKIVIITMAVVKIKDIKATTRHLSKRDQNQDIGQGQDLKKSANAQPTTQIPATKQISKVKPQRISELEEQMRLAWMEKLGLA